MKQGVKMSLTKGAESYQPTIKLDFNSVKVLQVLKSAFFFFVKARMDMLKNQNCDLLIYSVCCSRIWFKPSMSEENICLSELTTFARVIGG